MQSVVLHRVRALIGDVPTSLYECRNCGKTLEDDVEGCPACGATEIAHYDLG